MELKQFFQGSCEWSLSLLQLIPFCEQNPWVALDEEEKKDDIWNGIRNWKQSILFFFFFKENSQL